jgi:hypothetical protein
LICGAVATLLFIAGYVRGTSIALASHADDRIEVDDAGDISHFWPSAAFAVVMATVAIALAGVLPQFIYLGPALCIFTAAATGVAFFLEDSASH